MSGDYRDLMSNEASDVPLQALLPRRKLVVVVGIDDYKGLPKLRCAVSDALGVQNVLVRYFGFEAPIAPLINHVATKPAIEALVEDHLRKLLLPDDALILFFAGHGTTRLSQLDAATTVETGYLAPVDARGPDVYGDLINMEDLLRKIGILRARHILVVLDACHSGMALGTAVSRYRSADSFVGRLAANRSRRVITSARRHEQALDSGPIPGHSLFTGTLIRALTSGEADLDRNGIITFSELALFLQQQVGQSSGSRQTPDYGAFHLDDRGELVLMIRYGAPGHAATWGPAQAHGQAQAPDSRAYAEAQLVAGESYLRRELWSDALKSLREAQVLLPDEPRVLKGLAMAYGQLGEVTQARVLSKRTMERTWLVAIHAIGSASAATVAWRQGPQWFVTAVVKGTFAFVPNGSMALIGPQPIFAQEQEGAPGLGLNAADDLAPYLGQTDVLLTGHAPAPRSPAMRSVRVRLSILRDGATLLDKALEIEVPHGTPRPIPIAAMAPISKRWPIRRRLLGTLDPRRLEAAVLDIPVWFDWRYFQASATDMRMGSLRGDEWLVLEGVHPTLERIMTQLPGARAAARLYGPALGQETLALTLDTLHIDVDHRRCSLVWRGRFPVSDEPSSLRIAAGIETPGRPLLWPDLSQAAAAPPLPLIESQPEIDSLAGTIVMPTGPSSGATTAAQAVRPATLIRSDASPLASASTPTASVAIPEGDPLTDTLGLDESTASELAARAAAPVRSDASPLASASTAASVAIPEDDPLTDTLGFDESTASELAARAAVPVQRHRAQPPALSSADLHAGEDEMPRGPDTVPLRDGGNRRL